MRLPKSDFGGFRVLAVPEGLDVEVGGLLGALLNGSRQVGEDERFGI